jgi:YD repeat-containing protein
LISARFHEFNEADGYSARLGQPPRAHLRLQQPGSAHFAVASICTNYTDQLSKVTEYDYDEALRQTSEKTANDELLQFTYHPDGDLLTLIDGIPLNMLVPPELKPKKPLPPGCVVA